MKQATLYILVIILLTSISSFSQDGFERKILNDKYSWNNSTLEERNEYYFGIKPVTLSKYIFHFRYEKSSQIIDLYSDNGVDFKGQIVNIIQETKEIRTEYGKDSKVINYLFEKTEISIKVASEIGLLILNLKPFSMPTDSLIPNWNFRWTDCNALLFDYKIKENIYKKSYSCVENQEDSLLYVIRIKTLSDSITKIIELKKSFNNFLSKLPKGKTYIIDGWISMYQLTDKQNAYREKTKPIRDYQKTIKDTIDNYLKFELNRLLPNVTDLNCYDIYRLTFSKNGRLKRMKVNMGFWERMFDRDYYKCRRHLKKAFKNIKIDFVDPKYKFYRDLRFSKNRIYITDPTQY